ncbi:MAG: hypothetical protein LBQ54_07530 [Planctomycetaceae bacterium]|jgi:hypothetical protein|nr:hypothetical protein [Planctomycetaceae bacterium]
MGIEKKKGTWGGVRPGQGRKPKPENKKGKKVMIYLTRDILDPIEEAAEKNNITVPAEIRGTLEEKYKKD